MIETGQKIVYLYAVVRLDQQLAFSLSYEDDKGRTLHELY